MADGWSDASPSVNTIESADDAAWTHDAAEDASLMANTGGKIGLERHAVNAALDQMFAGDTTLTDAAYGWVEDTPASTMSSDGARLRIADSTTYQYHKDTGALSFSTGCVFAMRVRFDSWASTDTRVMGIHDGTKRMYVSAQKSGNDLIFKLQMGGSTWTYAGYFATTPDITLWLTVSGSTNTLYVDGVQRLQDTVQATISDSGFQIIQSLNVATDISIAWMKLYDGGAVSPRYSTTPRTSVAPQLDDGELSGTVTAWSSITVNTLGSFSGGVTEVGWRAYDGASWSAIAWTTITADGQVIDVSENARTTAIEISVRLASADGGAAPAEVTGLTVSWLSDVTPPSDPSAHSIVAVGSAFMGAAVLWGESTSPDASHHELEVSVDGGAYAPFSDRGKLQAGGVAMRFKEDALDAAEPAGWRYDRGLILYGFQEGQVLVARVRAVDASGNASAWVQSAPVTVSAQASVTPPTSAAYQGFLEAVLDDLRTVLGVSARWSAQPASPGVAGRDRAVLVPLGERVLRDNGASREVEYNARVELATRRRDGEALGGALAALVSRVRRHFDGRMYTLSGAFFRFVEVQPGPPAREPSEASLLLSGRSVEET